MIQHYSNNSTSIFRRCKYKYQFYYGGDKRTEDTDSSPGQRMGKAGHLALKGYNLALQEERVAASASGKGGEYFFSWDKIYRKALDWARWEFDPRDEEDMQEFRWLEKVLKNYFAATARETKTVLLVEEKVKIERFMGIFDLVAEQDGRRYVEDYKFQKSEQVSHVPTDSQISFYLLLARKMELNVSGLLLTIISTGKKKESNKPGKIIRTYATRSERFLDQFEEDLLMQVEEMDAFAQDPKPYRNWTKDCTWDCPLYHHCLRAMEGKTNG